MGGWISIFGNTPDLNDRLNNFKRTFSTTGMPELRLETYQHAPQARTIAWSWNQSLVPDVYVKKSDDAAIVLHGVITGLGRFRTLPSSQASATAHVLELWTGHRDELIKNLNGSFSCLFFDPNRHEITIFTDRFASRSVWYTRENGTWIIGNFPSAIAAIKMNSPTIDPVGLWSLFHTSRHVGNHGLFYNIRCLLAGEKAILSRDHQAVVRKWRHRQYDPERTTKANEWGERIAHVLKESSLRYKKTCTNPYIFLSGGLDSRIAAAALGKPLRAVTLCSMPNAETRIAFLVAKAVKIDYQRIIRSPYWYLDTLNSAALTSAGNFFTDHTHFIIPTRDISSNNTDAEFFLGDLLENFNKHYFSNSNGHNLPYEPQNIIKLFHSHIPYSLIDTNRLGIYFRDCVRQRIEKQYMQALQHYAQSLMDVSQDNADRLDTFLRWADVSITPTYNMITSLWPLAAERNIFFDNEVNEISLKIPSQLRGAGVLHKWTLHYLNKILPLIPNTNTFMPPIFPNRLGILAKKIRPVLGKIRRHPILYTRQKNKPLLNTSGSWLLMHEMYRKDSRYRKTIERLINDDIFPSDIFSLLEIRKTWQDYLSGNLDLHFEIQALLSFGTLHKLIPFDKVML